MKKILFIFLIVFFVSGCFSTAPNDINNRKDDSFFTLTLNSIDGEEVSLDLYRKSVPVFISFWATWCEPCKSELIKLNEMKDRYDGKIQFIGVATDTEESIDKVREFVAENSIEFPILIDPSNNVVSKILPGGDTVPYGILVDINGKIVHKQSGYEPGDEKKLETLFQSLLGN